MSHYLPPLLILAGVVIVLYAAMHFGWHYVGPLAIRLREWWRR